MKMTTISQSTQALDATHASISSVRKKLKSTLAPKKLTFIGKNPTAHSRTLFLDLDNTLILAVPVASFYEMPEEVREYAEFSVQF